MAETSKRLTACNRDCPDACGIVATIDGDRVIRLQGATDHPVTQGFLCKRTSRFLDRQYSPDRLTTPLIRNGTEFHVASWDDALERIAETMLRLKAESGPASIMHYRCGGSMGLMKHVSDYFFAKFGPVTVKSGDICSGAGEAAQLTDFGICDAHDLFDMKNSNTIILWSKNVFTSSVHMIPLLREAKAQGKNIVTIDPVHTRTAELATVFLQPRPAGDAALAMGIARWLIDHDRHDTQAANYCNHWSEYVALVQSRSVAEWATIANVKPSDLERVAEMYADGPSNINVGWGLQRRRYGAASVRAIDALGAMSGNLGIPGGGVSYYFQRRGAFDFSWDDSNPPPRTIPEPLVGPGINEAADPPIRMVWVTAANPVAMLPDSKQVADALQSRELTVVVDSFLTDTARCADIVLPTTTMLEEDDLLGAYGHHYVVEMRPVIPAPAQVKSDYEIVQALATRVGLSDHFSTDVGTWKQRLLQRVADHGVDLSQLEQGAIRNPFSPSVIFADREFQTPSGKANLIHELPEPLLGNATGHMTLAALSTPDAQGSQWASKDQEGPATATVHPDVANGFKDGDRVRLCSRKGEIEVYLRTDPNQRRDVVLMDKGGWLRSGRCANALIEAECTDDGECAVYYDTEGPDRTRWGN